MGNSRMMDVQMKSQTVDGLVSVITPLYNAENYIKDTIRSVQAQTYTNWEMIIIDDASADTSTVIVEQMQEQDARIRLLRNEENRGVAFARNYGIQEARGRYIAFLDSDDLWLPDKLQMQVETMHRTDCGFCYGNCQVIDAKGNTCAKNRVAPEKMNYKQLLYGNPIPCLTVVIDRWLAGQIEMPIMGHEDYATWLGILRERLPYAIGVGKIVAQYREVDRSLSGNKRKAAGWQWSIYRKYLHFSVIKSVYYFISYVYHALKKR